MAALADAVASNACLSLHHGGKATATTSAPVLTCNDSAAIPIQLAISSAAAFSQTGRRVVGMISPRSITEQYRDEANGA